MSLKFRGNCLWAFLVFSSLQGVGQGIGLARWAAASDLAVALSEAGSEQELRQIPLPEFTKYKKAASREVDPSDRSLAAWQGILLSEVVEKAMESLLPEKKAQVDLIILQSSTGERAMLPRAVVTKYPVLLATSRNRKELGPRGPIYSVVPWTSKPKMLEDPMPVETFFISDVKKVILANYQEKYGPVFLKRRTDPAAIRGEKLFVQACVACHASNHQIIGGDSHPAVKGAPKLGKKDVRALQSYLEAYRSENPGSFKGVGRASAQ